MLTRLSTTTVLWRLLTEPLDTAPVAANQPQAAPKVTPFEQPSSSDYATHLVSLRNPLSVNGSWAELKELYPDLLSEKDLEVREIDLGEQGTFYRVYAYPFAHVTEAKAACRKFRQLRQYCAVATLD